MTAPPDYEPTAFSPFAVTADVVVFTYRQARLWTLLVQRAHDPYRGLWAFPGGFVEVDEDLRAAAIRELDEETGVRVPGLEQLGAYGAPGRDPRMRVVTVVFWTVVASLAPPHAASDAAATRLWPVEDLLDDPSPLAFDHHQILTDAVAALEAGR
ncbi:MAG: NUDIX hydrolase [Acidimicrobiia bacterium]